MNVSITSSLMHGTMGPIQISMHCSMLHAHVPNFAKLLLLLAVAWSDVRGDVWYFDERQNQKGQNAGLFYCLPADQNYIIRLLIAL